jgi:hypothetical protein
LISFVSSCLRGVPLVALAAVTLHAQPATVRLAVEGHANATPSVAALGDFVAVAWGATPPNGGTDVYVALSRDSAKTFGPPVRVNRTAGEARLGGELPPSIGLAARASGDPDVVVAWGARAGGTVIRVARSLDGGRTFASETTLQSTGIAGDRGWHALAIDARGVAHIVWLDHRRLAARPKPTEHDHHKEGAAMAQLSSLYYARVLPNGTTSSERDVLPGVCYCCKTALAAVGESRLVAAWRHVYPGNIRDIAFAESRDGGLAFGPSTRVSQDQWQLAGCPDDGPALAVDRDGAVHLVWPTVVDGPEPTGAIFYATSRDGRTFTPRQRVPTLGSRKPGHPQIAIDRDGRLVIAWDEVIDGVRRASVVTATREAGRALVFGAPRTLGSQSAAYPMLAVSGARIVAAWTDGTGAEREILVTQIAR